MTGRLLTAREVADLLGVSTETILRWRRRGEVEAVVLPSGQIRFRPDVIDRLLEQWATPGRGVSTAPASAARPVPYGLSTAPEVEE